MVSCIKELKALVEEQAKKIEEQAKIIQKLQDENKELREENKFLKKKLNLSPESPTTPSGAKPAFIKPDSKQGAGKGKKPGRPKGHKGTTRKKPTKDEITNKEEHRHKECPDCGYEFEKKKPPTSTRRRIIQDISLPENLENTEHTIHGDWCPICKEIKEPVITDALPGFNIGLYTIIYSAFKHYHLGSSISKIAKELKILKMNLTLGGIFGGWKVLAEYLKPFYDEIHETIKNTKGALHADETGHRQKGVKYWLWSFSTKSEALFAIRRRRNGNVVVEILGNEFLGILITDFWKPYLAVKALFRQWCVAHFLREFKKIEFREKSPPLEYQKFRKKVKRLFRDALSFSKKEKYTREEKIKAHNRFLKRLDAVVLQYIDSEIKDVRRLAKRLRDYRDGFFTFVFIDCVDATNNHAERMIRYAVIMRKLSFHTMSDTGSETMEILMTVFKTLELRGIDPFRGTIDIVKKEIIKRKSMEYRLAG